MDLLYSNVHVVLMVQGLMLWWLASTSLSTRLHVVSAFRLLAAASFLFGLLTWLGVIR